MRRPTLALLAALVLVASASLMVQTPERPSYTAVPYDTPTQRAMWWEPVTALLVRYATANVSGAIVLVRRLSLPAPLPLMCQDEDFWLLPRSERPTYIRALRARGAVGIIAPNFPEPYDGALGPIGAPLDATHDLTEEQSVPMVDVRASDARVLAAAVAQGGVVVTLSSDDPNYWLANRDGFFLGLFQSTLIPLAFANAALVALKLLDIYLHWSVDLQVVVLALGVELVANFGVLFPSVCAPADLVARIIWIMAEPMFAFGTLPPVLAHLFSTISICLSIVAAFYFTLHWLQRHPVIHAGLFGKLLRSSIPITVGGVLLVALDVAASVLRSIPTIPFYGITYAAGVIEAILVIVLFVFTLANGTRLMHAFRKQPAVSVRAFRFVKMTKRHMLSAGVRLGLLIPAIMLCTSIFWTPRGFYATWWLLCFCSSLSSFILIVSISSANKNAEATESPFESTGKMPESRNSATMGIIGDSTKATVEKYTVNVDRSDNRKKTEPAEKAGSKRGLSKRGDNAGSDGRHCSNMSASTKDVKDE